MPLAPPSVLRLDSSPSVTEDVRRFDLARIRPQVKRTPQGFLQAPAFVTRAGVLEYRRADGRTVRELRPEAEVFHEDSLATLAHAPITQDHPKGGYVTPENAKALSIGHLTEKVSRSDGKVAATAIIVDKAAIEGVVRGDLREFSMGYQCAVENTSGVDPVHGRYDAIQRNIRYNHAALGGVSWGRAGEEIAIRMDKDDAVQVLRADAQTALELFVRDQMSLQNLKEPDAPFEPWELFSLVSLWEPAKRADLQKLATWLGVDLETLIALVPDEKRSDANPRSASMETITITIGGVEFTVPKNAGQAFQAHTQRQDAKIQELETGAEQASGRFDAQATELATAKTKIEELEDVSRFDTAVDARVELVAKAQTFLGAEAKIEGSRREVMESVLRKDNADLDLTDKSDDYVEARFDALVDAGPTGGPADKSTLLRNRQAAAAAAAAGGKDRLDSKAAKDGFEKKSQDAWKTPLAASSRPRG